MMSLVARRYSFVSSLIVLRVATLFVLSAIATTTQAQVNYYFNPPTGVDTTTPVNTWDLTNGFWNSVNQTTPAAPANNYTWTNDSVTNGGERANFGNTAGTVTLGTNISAYGINFNATGYTIAGGGNVLTLYGPGGPINVNTGSAGNATISAQVAGNVGLTVVGKNVLNGGQTVFGTLTLTAANTYSGGTTVTGATLVGNPQASGSPFSSGPITLNGAILNLKAATASATSATTVGNLTISGTTGSTVGSSQLIVDNQATSPSVTFAAGNLVRGGSGSALVITPNTGSLGNKERITFTNGTSLLTNGILPPWVVATPTFGSTAADFVTYSSSGAGGDWNNDGSINAGDYVTWRKNPSVSGGAGGYDIWRANFGNTPGGGNGVSVATYSSTDLTTSTSSSVVNQSTLPTITGNVSAYALKTNQAISLGGNTLTLGNGSGQTGLILNGGGSVTNGNINFGSTEATVFSQGNTTLGSAGNDITSNGLTITGLGATTVTINGNLKDSTAPAKLIYTATTANSGLVLNGANLYSGGTTLGVNNSGGTTATDISVGNDSAFGTGKVTNILLPSASSPLMQATGADHTLANAFDINGGLTFNGSQSLTFTGPFNIIQAQVGGTRTLNNTITTAGKSITYGSSGSPSTITLGNPVSNGGDGLGTTLIISSAASTSTVVNDTLVDPAAGGGAASGSVGYAGGANGVIRINSQNTYSGPTLLNGSSTVQIPNDTVGSYPSITSGPFGVGTLTPNNGTNNILQPIGGDRTIANPISMLSGFTVSNSTATGETTRAVTFTGPITLTSITGRTIANNLGAGVTETLGSSGSPSTITGSNTAAATLSFGSNNAGNITIVNDVMQDGSTPMPVVIANANTVIFNALNTYSGGTTLTGAGTIIPIVHDTVGTPGSITSGPFGTGHISNANGSSTNPHLRPSGGNRIIANPFDLFFGITMDNATGELWNLTLTGQLTLQNTGRFISNGFSNVNVDGSMILGDPAQPSTIVLSTATNQNLSFGANSGPIVVNDVIQDATGIAGNISVNPNAGQNAPVIFNAQNTFTGNANLGSGGNAASGQARLGVGTDGDFGAINSGPLGKGTIIAGTTSATAPPLTPFNADRTLSNSVNINGNLGAANAPSENFNLNLTGPITLGSASRSIINNMTGTLTLGKSTLVDSTQPVTLSGTAAQTLTFTGGSSSATVVNDVIQNGGSGLIPGQLAVSGSIVRFNNANTYGPTSPGTTTNTTVSGSGKLLVNNSSGSGTGSGNVSVTGGTLGGTGTISQSVTASGGAIAPGDPLVNNGAGTLNIGGNLTYSSAGGLTVELGGTSAGINYDQLLVAGTANLASANGGTLTVSLINGFSPSVDTDFTVLTATGGLTTNAGAGFGNFAYPDFTHWTTNYTANSVVVHYSAAGGAGAGGGLSGGAVPEPGTLALLICALGSVLFTSPRASRRRI